MVRRNVLSPSDALQEPIIVDAFSNQHAETWIGNGRTRIAGQSSQNYLIALSNQMTSDRFADPLSSSNSMKMLLPLDRYALYENIVIHRAGLRKNRLGDLNRIIKCQRTDCFDRRAIYRCKS